MPDNLIINLPILAKACSVYSRFGSAMTGMTTHAPNVGNIGVYSAVQFGASWTLWRCSIHAHQIKLVVPRAHRCSRTVSSSICELAAARSALGHIEPSSASLTMRAPCRRRPRSRRYGARASNSALASLKCIQSLTIRCCLMHSATCSHPWRREVNRKCVVSIDTSILSTSACACERIHNVAACLLALSGLLILSSLPRESSIA